MRHYEYIIKKSYEHKNIRNRRICGTQYEIDKCEGGAFYRICFSECFGSSNWQRWKENSAWVNKYTRMKTFTDVRPAASSAHTVLSADSDITLVTWRVSQANLFDSTVMWHSTYYIMNSILWSSSSKNLNTDNFWLIRLIDFRLTMKAFKFYHYLFCRFILYTIISGEIDRQENNTIREWYLYLAGSIFM